MAKRRTFRNETADEDDKTPKTKLTIKSLRRTLALFHYMGRHKWKFYLGMVFLALTAATALIFPSLIGDLMGLVGGEDARNGMSGLNKNLIEKLNNTYLDQSTKDQLIAAANVVGLQLLVLFALQAVFSFFRVLLFSQATENLLAGLRQDVYGRLVRMPMSFFSRNQVAELNSRISADISQLGDTVTTAVAEFLRQFIIIAGGVTMICVLSWKLSLLMLAVVPPIALITVFFGRRIRKFSRQLQDRIADSNIIVGESLTGISNVKSFTNEAYEIERYRKSTNSIVDTAIQFARARGLFFSFIIFCLFGSIILIVWAGVRMTVEDELTAGQMLQFMFYTVFVGASFGGLPEQYAQIQKAVGASERLFELLSETHEPVNTNPAKQKNSIKLQGEVAFRKVGFSYPTRKEFTVLEEVTFEAGKGQTIALVGHSGSGKSTIAQLLLRFYDPDKGEILFDEKNAREYDLTELRENMAIVPQDVLLFGGTIRENIAYGKPGANDAEIIDAARKANALGFIESFPDKLDTKVGDRGIQLSGGQRQRIAIARAVLKDPSILILDEATSSLDSESERLVQEALDKLMLGRTSFVIAHRLSTIRNADKIVVIDKGKVAETGTHEELMAKADGIYKGLVRLQYRDEGVTSSVAPEKLAE